MTNDIYIDESRYEIVQLPSKGECYRNKVKVLPVGYLTALDENIITSPQLLENGTMCDVLLEKKILDKTFNVKDLCIADREAILLWLKDDNQKEEVELVFNNVKGCDNLDYIACWFLLGSRYIKGTRAKYAFVSTNSICQGLQVSLLWPHIFQDNQEIFFAHHSFKWTNNAKYNAGVTCVIVGVREVAKGNK